MCVRKDTLVRQGVNYVDCRFIYTHTEVAQSWQWTSGTGRDSALGSKRVSGRSGHSYMYSNSQLYTEVVFFAWGLHTILGRFLCMGFTYILCTILGVLSMGVCDGTFTITRYEMHMYILGDGTSMAPDPMYWLYGRLSDFELVSAYLGSALCTPGSAKLGGLSGIDEGGVS
jgi:hypothetical protein